MNGGLLDSRTIRQGTALIERPVQTIALDGFEPVDFSRTASNLNTAAAETAPAYISASTLTPVSSPVETASASPLPAATSAPGAWTPFVNAAVDQAVIVPSEVGLTSTATGASTPGVPGQPATAVMRISGTGTLTFTDGSTAVDATRSFAVEGAYLIELSADGAGTRLDGGLDITDVADATPPPPGSNDGGIITPPSTPPPPSSEPPTTGGGNTVPDPVDVTPPGSENGGWDVPSEPSSTPGTDYDPDFGNSEASTDPEEGSDIEGQVPANNPPSVSAGPDRTLVVTSLPASDTFTGSVGDDGLPGALTVRWTKASGPGAVLFGSPTSATTTAAFTEAGDYLLHLTADDTALESVASVGVSVLLNQAPLVNAGADMEVRLPSSANLSGWISDDGVPDDQLVITWSQVSGPGQTVFTDASSAETTAAFPVEGTYVLRLRASDRDLSTTDEITITVAPSSDPEPEQETGDRVYVARNGNDSNAGTQTSPYRTIRKAFENVAPGDTIVIRAGVYDENLRSADMFIPSGESWDKPITVQGATGEVVVLRPTRGGGVINLNGNYSYLIFKNLVVDAVNMPGDHAIRFAAGAHHNRLDTVEVMNSFGASNIHTTGAGSDFNEFINVNSHSVKFGESSNQYHGIYIKTSDNLIEGGAYHHNAFGAGIHIYNPVNAHRNVVRNIRSFANRSGMVIGSGDRNTAYNNLIYNNLNGGVSIGYGGVNTAFNNNIVVGSPGYAVTVLSSGTNTEIRNNIFWGNARDSVRDLGKSTVTSSNLTVDPKFMDPGKDDYRPKAGSPAIDAGAGVLGVVSDIDGVPRPQGSGYDIGPYER